MAADLVVALWGGAVTPRQPLPLRPVSPSPSPRQPLPLTPSAPPSSSSRIVSAAPTRHSNLNLAAAASPAGGAARRRPTPGSHPAGVRGSQRASERAARVAPGHSRSLVRSPAGSLLLGESFPQRISSVAGGRALKCQKTIYTNNLLREKNIEEMICDSYFQTGVSCVYDFIDSSVFGGDSNYFRQTCCYCKFK